MGRVAMNRTNKSTTSGFIDSIVGVCTLVVAIATAVQAVQPTSIKKS